MTSEQTLTAPEARKLEQVHALLEEWALDMGVEPDPRNRIPSVESDAWIRSAQAGYEPAAMRLLLRKRDTVSNKIAQSGLLQDSFVDAPELAVHVVYVNGMAVGKVSTRMKSDPQTLYAAYFGDHLKRVLRDLKFEGQSAEEELVKGKGGDNSVEHRAFSACLEDTVARLLGYGGYEDRAEANLSKRERMVLVMRLGLDGRGQRSLQQIGQEIGISREYVRQLENSALFTLGRDQTAQELRDFLDLETTPQANNGLSDEPPFMQPELPYDERLRRFRVSLEAEHPLVKKWAEELLARANNGELVFAKGVINKEMPPELQDFMDLDEEPHRKWYKLLQELREQFSQPC